MIGWLILILAPRSFPRGLSVWLFMIPRYVIPFGISLLRPRALFGLEGISPLTHGVFWSMLANVGGLFVVSLTAGGTATLQRLHYGESDGE